ncbi:hypothetical protein LTR56_000844 [Elasticomyces elasticus]|nr:hypothetical protein LTR22_018629 [Elasticomyces elasticus]KAK3660468.1 hypothetical protein LTR56_000844 [Elasticomyces elasticus]KAK4912270.1 hypothetical protein LTR49_019271 [Elasticomyces elasticus]KAK5751796.1 hypothetical protein LTS12_018124 [Elasticomyces elasticus]
MAHSGLIKCAAFSGQQNCIKCGHHWQQHLHILYELREQTVTVIDNGIQQQLANHADDITLKQMALTQKQALVAEYRQEREIIRDAGAKFCVFLKNNLLAPYNDALIAYLDFLIKEEQAKVQVGGNNQRLLSLTLERNKHEEAIKIITRDMDSSVVGFDLSEGGVDRMVQGLYLLKHFGDNLKALKQGIGAAHQATYRERPYNVKCRVQPRFEDHRPLIQPSEHQQGRGATDRTRRPEADSSSGSTAETFASIAKKALKKGFGL